MAKRDHTVAMTEVTSAQCTLSFSSGSRSSCQYPSSSTSAPYGRAGSQSSGGRPLGSYCRQAYEPPSKYRCTEGSSAETAISVSSTDSEWSTSPQCLSGPVGVAPDEGMTLRLSSSHVPARPAGHWVEYPTQEAALAGCGSWSLHGFPSDRIKSLSFDQALALSVLQTESSSDSQDNNPT